MPLEVRELIRRLSRENRLALPAPGPLAIETNDPPKQLEVDRVFFLEIDIPGIGVVKVKVTTCKQGTSGCP